MQCAFLAGHYLGQAQLRAALRAESEPVGYKLVPIEPTPEMIDAGMESLARVIDPSGPDVLIAYAAMLATAPQTLPIVEREEP